MADGGLRQKLFGFRGRLRRQDWWLLGLATALVQMAVMLTVHLLVFGPGESFLGTLRITETGLTVSPAWWVATGLGALGLWPQLAMGVKRGHDIGWSGGLTTALYLVGFVASLAPGDVGAVFGAQIDAGRPVYFIPLALLVVSMIANLVLVAVLGFVDGPRDANRYGASPKAQAAEAVE